MFDDELKYCPVCRDEYRAEIRQCAACDVSLIDGARMRKECGSAALSSEKREVIGQDDQLIPLLRGRLLELKQIKNMLASQGIPAVLVNEGQCRNGSCGGPEMLLKIRLQDQQKAEEALQQEHERTTGQQIQAGGVATIFDPESELAECPACGHEFTPNGSECPDCGLRLL